MSVPVQPDPFDDRSTHPSAAELRYPVTARHDHVVDTYGAAQVPDPYRWLEDDRSADTEGLGQSAERGHLSLSGDAAGPGGAQSQDYGTGQLSATFAPRTKGKWLLFWSILPNQMLQTAFMKSAPADRRAAAAVRP